MKKRFLYLILPIITLILEALPYGAVCIFASSPTEKHRETFSYFDLTPFGYANFAPLFTAIITCSLQRFNRLRHLCQKFKRKTCFSISLCMIGNQIFLHLQSNPLLSYATPFGCIFLQFNSIIRPYMLQCD